jgi:tetratricopeptide (TPR) repeat protein
MVGRGLLQAESSETQALAFLRHAAQLDPQNPKFAYWEGVGYWANGDTELERRSYFRGLSADPDNIDLLINLGHSYLGDRRYDEALEAYKAVLRLSPGEPSATYNSGLIYRAKQMVPEEIDAWKHFLVNNRIGTKAFRAVERLNGYGDYSFRTYQIGYRKVIVNQQVLLDNSLSYQRRGKELEEISSILKHNQRMNLEVVVFVENDSEAARNKALEIKRILVDVGGTNLKNQVRLSWFDVPETIDSQGDKVKGVLSEGLLFFCRLEINNKKENVI